MNMVCPIILKIIEWIELLDEWLKLIQLKAQQSYRITSIKSKRNLNKFGPCIIFKGFHYQAVTN